MMNLNSKNLKKFIFINQKKIFVLIKENKKIRYLLLIKNK
jgi:hypothetical protein